MTGIDVTTRKKTEETLPKSELQYRVLFEENTHPMWVLDAETLQFLDVNEAAIRHYGYSREEFLKMKGTDIRPPEDVPAFLVEVSKPHTLDDASNLWRHYKKDGSLRLVQITSFCIRFEGRPAKLAFVNDVTERELARECLRQSQAQMNAIISSAMDGIITMDWAGNVIVFNAAAEKMFGRSAADVIGTSMRCLIPHELRERHHEGFVKFLASDERTTFGTFSAVRSDGSRFLVEASVAKVEISGQKICTVITRDITERQLAEEQQRTMRAAIERAASEWRKIFDVVPSALLVVDANGKVERLNRSAKDLFGVVHYTDVLGRPVSEFATREPWRELARVIPDAAEGRKAVMKQVQNDAGNTWSITAVTLEEKSIIILRDITQIIALQDSLRRSEAMASMGALVGGIAHEVRNPLFGISSTIDTFEACFGDRTEFHEYISILRGEVERLRKLMQELLEYGTPPTRELSHSSVPEVIDKAAQICRLYATQAGVRVKTVRSGSLPLVPMNSARLTVMFRNLIENAIQHSSKDGEVVVEARLSDTAEPEVVCRVADSGPGFRQQDLSRVFEPFFSRRQGGTGLGLSIVQRIVEEHNGIVKAGNISGGGGFVEVRLPLYSSTRKDYGKS